MNIREVILGLAKRDKTISVMESCTGGGLCNEITNIEGASQVFKFGAVTYCNEYKVKLGVSKYTIEKFGVYSAETAREMSKAIAEFAGADYGIGVTGKLNCRDTENPEGEDNAVYISLCDGAGSRFYDLCIKVNSYERKKNKEEVLEQICCFMVNNVLRDGA